MSKDDYYEAVELQDFTQEERFDLLIEAARATGFTIDYLEALTKDLSRQAFLKVIDNASSIPSIMKSIDNPYVFRSAIAPSKDSR